MYQKNYFKSEKVSMKIAYIIPSLINSGPIRVVHSLVNELQKEHEIEIYYFKVPQRDKLTFEVPTHQIRFGDAIAFDSYDIIHSHTILADAYVYYYSRKIKRAKTVTTLHNYAKEDFAYSYGKFKAYFMVKIWNIVTSKHDKIVTLSKDAKEYYKKFWKNKKIDFVYNGVPTLEESDNQENKNIESKFIKIGTIASAGGVNKRKGIDQIIKALPALKNYELYIAGKDTQESENLKKLAEKIGVLNRIHLLGYIDNISEFIVSMDIFMLAPRSEGFSLALQEIVRHKKPIICSDIPIFRELYTEDEVVYFTLENIKSLVNAVKNLQNKKEALIKNAYKKFLESFTTQKMAKNYLKVYGELLDER